MANRPKQSSRLLGLMHSARDIRLSYERGDIGIDERDARIADLIRPRSFWAWLLG